jgi:hypothetical protein
MKSGIDLHVYYLVESCTMNLGRGNARFWVVKQVNGARDQVPVAMFAVKEHAEHYANWLILQKHQITQ